MAMKTEILKMLAGTDDYLSGQTICDTFGVSRTAVWKAIKQLREEGFPIEAVQNRGYRLVGTSDKKAEEIYSETAIASALQTDQLGRNLIFFSTTDSTNTQARRLAEEGAPEGTLVVADEQNAGRGRRGRGWVSEPGSGIWMSFLLRPSFAPDRASMLTLTAAMAVAEGIEKTTGLSCQIKWPNDVIYEGKKICGILTEMSTDMDTILYVIVGMGINVTNRSFPEEIRDTATSLKQCGAEAGRVNLIAAILKAFEELYKIFQKTEDLSALRCDYQSRLVNVGREVRVLAQTGEYTGISKGISTTGELIVELQDGEERRISSGEVSVRGVYGYV